MRLVEQGFEILTVRTGEEMLRAIELRTSSRAHLQMRDLARQMLTEFRTRYPVLFDGVGYLG